MTSTGSLLIICCLASARAAAVAVAAAAAAGVINARSFIVAIELEGLRPSFDTLEQCYGAVQVDGLHCACCGSPERGSGGVYLSLPATKVDKKTTHQSTSTAGDEEVGGRRRRQGIKRGGGPGRWEALEQGEAEAPTQQPVRVYNEM